MRRFLYFVIVVLVIIALLFIGFGLGWLIDMHGDFLWSFLVIKGWSVFVFVMGVTASIIVSRHFAKKSSREMSKMMEGQIESSKKEFGKQTEIFRQNSKKQIFEFKKINFSTSCNNIINFLKCIALLEEIEGLGLNGEDFKMFVGMVVTSKMMDKSIALCEGIPLNDNELEKKGSPANVSFSLCDFYNKMAVEEVVNTNDFDTFVGYYGWEIVKDKYGRGFNSDASFQDKVEFNIDTNQIWIKGEIEEKFKRWVGEFLYIVEEMSMGKINNLEAEIIWRMSINAKS